MALNHSSATVHVHANSAIAILKHQHTAQTPDSTSTQPPTVPRSSRTSSMGASSSASSRSVDRPIPNRAILLNAPTFLNENDTSDDSARDPPALANIEDTHTSGFPDSAYENSRSGSLPSRNRTYPSGPGWPFDSIDPDLIDMGHIIISGTESLSIEQRRTRKDFLATGGLGDEVAAPSSFFCLICQETETPGSSVVRLHQAENHEFCFECIYKWLMDHNTCPKCRHELFVKEPNKEPLMLEAYNPVPARNDDDFVDWVADLVRDDRERLIRPATHSAMFGTISDADMAGLQVRLVRVAERYVREEVAYGLGRMLPEEILDLPDGFFEARYRLYKLDIVEIETPNYRHHMRGFAIPEGAVMHVLGPVDSENLSEVMQGYWMCRLQELAQHHGRSLGVAVHPAAGKFVELMGSQCRLMRGEEFDGMGILGSALKDGTLPGARFEKVFAKHVKEPELRDAFLEFWADLAELVAWRHHQRAVVLRDEQHVEQRLEEVID